MTTAATPFRDKSLDLTGASQQVFADAGYKGIEERFIANPNAANAVWINPFGNAAVANDPGLQGQRPDQGCQLRYGHLGERHHG
jgi:hypothetical protein